MSRDPHDSDSASSGEDSEYLDALLEFENAATSCQALSEQEWIARHPQLEERLRKFLERRKNVSGIVVPEADPQRVIDLGDFSHYREVTYVGRGGNCSVHQAIDTNLQRTVALKIPLWKHAQDHIVHERLKREALLNSRMEHPNIVPVYECGEFAAPFGNCPYIAMRFVGRLQKLSDLLEVRTDRPADQFKFIVLFHTVCQAMAYAHQNNIIHRDLKPGNIFVGQFGDAYVGDWGLAKHMTHTSETAGPKQDSAKQTCESTDPAQASANEPFNSDLSDGVHGTPRYLAPEVAANGLSLADKRTDVFGLGGILLSILTNAAPFDDADPTSVLAKATRGDLTAAWGHLDKSRRAPELINLAKKCLASLPEDRLPDAKAIADRVADYLHQQEQLKVQAERRLRHLTIACALSAIVVLVILAGTWFHFDRAARLREAQTRQEQRQRRTRQEVDRALQEAAELHGKAEASRQDSAIWDAAVASARRAQTALESGEPDEEMPLRVRTTLVQLESGRDAARKATQESLADRRLVDRLAAVRAQRLTPRQGSMPNAWAAASYKEAFAEFGFDIRKGQAAEAANRLRPSVRLEEAAALDDWALVCATQGAVWDALWLLEVSKLLDPDPWRNKVRSVLVWFDAKALKRLAEESRSQQLPAANLILLAGGLMWTHQAEEAAACLSYAQRQRFQDDFFINGLLGELYAMHVNPPQPENAVRYLMAAVAIQKGNPVGHTGLGVALQMTGQLEEAVNSHRRAIELDPRIAFVHSNLAWALMEQGKVDEAIDSCRTAIGLDPKMAGAYTNLGIGLLAKGNLDKALAACRTAVKLDRNLALARNTLGLALRRTGHPDDAISCYRKAIELDPKQPEPHNNLSIILKERRQFDDALRSCRKAIELDPKFAPAYSNLGAVLAEMGQNQEAISACRKSIDLSPRHAEPYTNMGVALWHEGKQQDAIGCFRKAIEIEPNHAEAHTNLGALLLAEGMVVEAIVCHRKAIEADSRSAMAYSNLCAALAAKREYGEAQACARKAIELDPMHAMGYLNLGGAFANSGHLDEAFPLYLKAIELDPKLASAHKNLGLTYRSKGKFADAAASLRTAERLFVSEKNGVEASFVGKLARECERMAELEAGLAGFLRGEFHPKDNDERVALIYLCQERKFHRTATRLSVEAFAADPKLADNLRNGYRYNSACSAALAAFGEAEDLTELNQQDKIELRTQALAWLRANLNLWNERLLGGNAIDRASAHETMQHWLDDSDLSGLRDAVSLEKLPIKEREDWQQFWRDVEALLRKSH